jgi:hypothetical protein
MMAVVVVVVLDAVAVEVILDVVEFFVLVPAAGVDAADPVLVARRPKAQSTCTMSLLRFVMSRKN